MARKKPTDLKAGLKILKNPLVIIGIIAMIYATFAVFYISEMQKQQQVSAQLTTVNSLLRLRNPQELASQLEEVKAHLEELRDTFPDEDISQVVITNRIYEVASDSGVTVANIRLSETTREEIFAGTTRVAGSGTVYTVLPVSVAAWGNLTQVLQFISTLESGSAGLETLIVNTVTINQAEGFYGISLNIKIYMNTTTN